MTRSSPFRILQSCQRTNPWGSRGQTGAPTVSRVDLGEGALGLPQHDGNRGVVLLHDRVGSCEEGPGHRRSLAWGSGERAQWDDTPGRGAVVARLAEEEADLLQPLGESISARHVGCFVDGLAGGELVLNWSSTS